jgi:hypothetical protein
MTEMQGVKDESDGFRLDQADCEKITSLHPHLIDAVHVLLKSHGVDAVVHGISFRPTGASANLGEICSPPCCYINGVWTCPCYGAA